MRPAIRLLVALLGVAVLGTFLRARSPQGPPEPSASAVPHQASPLEEEPEAAALLSRNPFAYADGTSPLSSGPPRRPAPVASPLEPTPSVRLTGFVRQGGQQRAALVLPEGDVVLLAPGEMTAGYAVLALEGDDGVRLRTPEGREFVLRLEP